MGDLMKLRNKKTGLIIDFEEINCYYLYDCGDKIILAKNSEEPVYGYTTLKEFNEDWEDYNPKEPLIKDEKIRKAVRAWAEVNKFSSKMFFTYYANLYQLSCWQASIEFNRHIEGLEDGKEYYFAELCGEEE